MQNKNQNESQIESQIENPNESQNGSQIESQNEWTRIRCISGSTLKLIAMFTMLIDHIGAVLFENFAILQRISRSTGLTLAQLGRFDRVLRGIGRSAFPIFCFLLIEGYFHTSDKKKYAIRLALFTLLSEIPFDLAITDGTLWSISYQNVMFTLLIGFLVIWGWDHFQGELHFQFLVLGAGCALAYFLRTDYDYLGVLLIFVLFISHDRRVLQSVAGIICVLWEWPAIFAFIPINLYNGKRGLRLKYTFYFFYPVHLLILYLIQQAILNFT